MSGREMCDMEGVRHIEITNECLEWRVVAEALVMSGGIQVSVYGGDRPHIGAVSIVSGSGEPEVLELPGHREGIIARRWAERLSEAGLAPVVINVGIHYDHLPKARIQTVLDQTESMLEQLIERLASEG